MKTFCKPAYLAIGIFSFSLAGCAQDLRRISEELQTITNGLARPSQAQAFDETPSQSLAQSPAITQRQSNQGIRLADKRVEVAANAALPTINEILAKHSCMKSNESMRMMNFYAIPGVDIYNQTKFSDPYPNHVRWMKSHNRDKCVSIRAMDRWAMPALNALTFRVVYFADDSGETINFQYEFRRMEDGSWKLANLKSHVD